MTNETKLEAILSDDEIAFFNSEAERIAKEKGFSKVHPVILMDPETYERRKCYLSEPNYLTKIAVLDKAAQLGVFAAGEELRKICTIQDESDQLTWGEAPECDSYKLGVVEYSVKMVKRAQNQFKKK
jgi:hypothetical protein